MTHLHCLVWYLLPRRYLSRSVWDWMNALREAKASETGNWDRELSQRLVRRRSEEVVRASETMMRDVRAGSEVRPSGRAGWATRTCVISLPFRTARM
jgi:hypothetical protein